MKKNSAARDVVLPETDFLLDLASMFEGEFSLDWLEELTRMKASVILSILEDQAQKGVLIRSKPAIYSFETKRRQEWLKRLTPEQKERFHRQIASILIRELAEDDAKPLEIAQHLLQVGVDWKGCQWLMRAGEIYADSFDAQKAQACFNHILTQLSSQRGEQQDLLFIKAAIAHSNNYAGRSNLNLYYSFLKDARDRAEKRDWQPYVVMLEMHIAKYERLNSEFNRGYSRFQKAYAKAGIINDPKLSSDVAELHTYFLFWQGRFQEAIEVFEKSVPDVHKTPIGFFPLLASMMVGHCYTMIGQVTQGLGMLDNARNYCLKSGDRYLLAHASSSIAMAMLSINRLDDTISYLKLSLKEADETDNAWVKSLATLMMALVLHLKGNSKNALTFLRRFQKLKDGKTGNLLFFPYLLEICYAMDCGELQVLPGFSLGDEISRMLKINNCFLKGLAYRYKAQRGIHSKIYSEEIIEHLNLSLQWLKKSGFRVELAKTHLSLTRYYLTAGNTRKARQILADAADILVADEFNLIPDDLRPLIKDENYTDAMLNEILDMAEHMSTGYTDSRLLQHIITTANRIIGAERGALLVENQEDGGPGMLLRASKNITMDQISDPFFASSMEMIQEVIRSGKSRIFEAKPISDGSAPFEKETIRSCICLPLVARKEVIGVLYHDNRLLGNLFKPLDIKLLKFFAALAALDLDREKMQKLLTRQKNKKKDEIVYARPDYSVPDHRDGMIGESQVFKRILDQINQVAITDTAVLITGETGVGKNLVAAAIHRKSPRGSGPYVTVQCSALTEGLITSELFGHEKGAFTGATNRHIGRFELADTGTLFLDEIGDLSLEVQARLLRVLQSKEFERVGGGKDVLTSDFRLIAATNKNLEAEVRAKRFREDLFFRINVFPILVPPLRERKEDIPLLATHILRNLDHNDSRNRTVLSQNDIKRLLKYDWPGNIRELENVIQRGLISGDSGRFQIPQLQNETAAPSGISRIQSLEENERQHILAALVRSRGKVHGPGGAAELLSINPSTLSSRLKKLGIKRDSILKAGDL